MDAVAITQRQASAQTVSRQQRDLAPAHVVLDEDAAVAQAQRHAGLQLHGRCVAQALVVLR